MKLNDALKAVAATRALPAGHEAFLACGFEPLHLPTFLRAWYAQRFPDRSLDVAVGVYGDLVGNLERARRSGATLAWLVLEWSDVNPRLGLRSTGAWSGPSETVLAEARERLNRLREGIVRLAEQMPLVVAGPSLSFPLLGHTSGWQASELELELELELARYLADVARIEKVSVLHAGRLATASPAQGRSDPRLELAAGFPYTADHASALAEGLIGLGFPRAPKKGLITDLDDTLWSGIVGEVGADTVSWSQAEHTQVHAVYQLFLRQLADAGVLLAIASKNEPDLVRAALARHDLLVDGDAFFPIAASWGPKSEAVSAILRAWNIAADAVVMVDDSRMELEEIRRLHPGIECIEFTPKDPRRTLEALTRLRDTFGKPRTLEEDKLRAASIKSSALFEQQKSSGDLQSFLVSLDGAVSFDARTASDGGRWLELINKTNQFNLNGARLSEGEWSRQLGERGHVALGVAYADRYGPLGTISVVSGRVVQGAVRRLEIDHWVLSCRAFSRRIEDHTLSHLFDWAEVEVLGLTFGKTQRNQPFCEFLDRLGLLPAEDGLVEIRRSDVASKLRDLPHRVNVAG